MRPTHTLVRPGLMVYGVRPRPLSPEIDVRPVMQLSADIALVKDVAPGTRTPYGGGGREEAFLYRDDSSE